MNKCNKCKVEIIGTHEFCPLCKNLIETKKQSGDIFPNIPTIYERYKRLITRMIFLSFGTAITTIIINHLTTEFMWSWFVVLGLFSFWIILISAMKTRKNKIRSIFTLTLIITCLVIIWDYITGWHKWSIEFVLPALFTFQIVASALLALVINIKVMDWLFYIFLEIIIGFSPLLFISRGDMNIKFPSYICVVLSALSLGVMIIFGSKALIEELKKRLHV